MALSVADTSWTDADKDARASDLAGKRGLYEIEDRPNLDSTAIRLKYEQLVELARARLPTDLQQWADDPDEFLAELPYTEHDRWWKLEIQGPDERDGDDHSNLPIGRRPAVSEGAALPSVAWTYLTNTFFPQPLYWIGLGVPDVEKLNNFYRTYYGGLDRSPAQRVQDNWHTDRSFADQRIAGVNPMVIERVRDASSIDLDGDSLFDDAHLQRVIPSTLAEAVDDRRLYVCDYNRLASVATHNGVPPPFVVDEIPAGVNYLGALKYVSAPIALFYWNDAGGPGTTATPDGTLIPVGIQLRRGAGTTRNQIVQPGDPNWLLAKTVVQCADAHVHELQYHLAWTHLKLEIIKLCAERWLHADHPLLRLLRPHLELLLRIQVDLGDLIDQGRPVDALLAPQLDDGRTLVIKAMGDPFCMHANPMRELAARGMGPGEAPIDYPYRDDGLRVWQAIVDYVTDFVGIFYTDDATVLADYELQNFVLMVDAETEGGLTGFVEGLDVDPASPTGTTPIATKTALVDMLAMVIWNSGPQHAAVNYPQWDFMGHVPNMPLATYISAPLDGQTPPSYPGLVGSPAQYFPPDFLARTQVGVMYFLATYKHNRLGRYRGDPFDSEGRSDAVSVAVNAAVRQFDQALERLQDEIEEADRQRSIHYPYLHPVEITNSTHI